MNKSFLGFAMAACLLPLAPSIAHAAPAREMALRWSELQPVIAGRQISVHLTDGATVEGRYRSLQADALSIEVKKTSDPAKHPKGAALLARREVAGITVLRHAGSKGRVIGLVAGGGMAVHLVRTRGKGHVPEDNRRSWNDLRDLRQRRLRPAGSTRSRHGDADR